MLLACAPLANVIRAAAARRNLIFDAIIFFLLKNAIDECRTGSIGYPR
jgi:hypothetical protein